MVGFDAADVMLSRLQQSAFRARFMLYAKERAYLDAKGMETVMQHADQFIRQRLSAAFPVNDGKQTPWRGHPVFIAQHATATCCRSCLEKWHHIAKGRVLSEEEHVYILSLIRAWLVLKSR